MMAQEWVTSREAEEAGRKEWNVLIDLPFVILLDDDRV